MNNQVSQEKLKELIDLVSKRLGTDKAKLTEAAANGSLDKLLANLDARAAEKLQKVLSDPKSADKLLSSPQAQQILAKVTENK